MGKYRHVGDHAVNVNVGDKTVPLAPGDFVTLSSADEKDEYNQSLGLMQVSGEKGGDDK